MKNDGAGAAPPGLTFHYNTLSCRAARGSVVGDIIHIISGRDGGGAKTHVLRLLTALAPDGNVRLVCLSNGVLAESAKAAGLPCTVVEGSFFAQLRRVRALSQGASILHCHGSRANLTGALLKGSLPGVKVISTVHSDHRLDYLRRPLARLTYGTLNAWALRRMDALVCVSDAMRCVYASRGFSRDRLFSIYNGIDMNVPTGDRASWLHAHGIPADGGEIFAGTAARFNAVKDLPTMLRGFALAAETCPQLRLILAGSGPEENALRTLADELGIAERVYFPGWVEDTEGLYASLDVCLLTSVSETFPYALTDAAKYRVPVISTAVGGVPELVEDGVNGLLIAPGDARSLGEKLAALCGDGALRKTLGAALYDTVREKFSMDATAERQRAIYRAVLTERRGIVISGAYGCGNRGDELMLEALLRGIRRDAPESAVTVLSHRPKETERRFDVDSIQYLDFPRIARSLRRANTLLLGGGNLLQDDTSRRSLAYYLALLRTGHRLGCRCILPSAGLGPLSEGGWRKTAKTLNECAERIVFRERASLEAAKAHGITKPVLEPGRDAALDTAVPEAERGEALLFCPRPLRGGTEITRRFAGEAAAFASAHGMRIVFLAMNVRSDAPVCRELSREFGGTAADAPEDTASLAKIFASAAFTVSMRLHALTLSYLAGTPRLGIDTDGRIAASSEELETPFVGLEYEKFTEALENARKDTGHTK